MKNLFLSIFISILLVGCFQESRLDGSSEDAMTKSIEKMEKSLTEEEQEELALAILFIGFDGKTPIDLVVSVIDPSVLTDEARQRLDGLTYEEVLEKSAEVRKRKGKMLRNTLESIFDQ